MMCAFTTGAHEAVAETSCGRLSREEIGDGDAGEAVVDEVRE